MPVQFHAPCVVRSGVTAHLYVKCKRGIVVSAHHAQGTDRDVTARSLPPFHFSCFILSVMPPPATPISDTDTGSVRIFPVVRYLSILPLPHSFLMLLHACHGLISQGNNTVSAIIHSYLTFRPDLPASLLLNCTGPILRPPCPVCRLSLFSPGLFLHL